MAKVKTTTGKQPGKAATSANKTAGSNEVVAIRNGEEMTFTRQIWDHLPPGKDGWEEVSAEPALVGTTSNTNALNLENASGLSAKDAYKKAASAYKEVFGEDAPSNLTTEDIINSINQKTAADEANASHDHALAHYKEVFGQDAAEGLSTEALNSAIVAELAKEGK